MLEGDAHIQCEKEKARELRKSRWWSHQIDRGVCHYCQTKITRGQATMDHVIPLSRGGFTTKSNVVVACKECNNKKKDRELTDWALKGV